MEQRQELLARINQTGRKLSKGQKRIAEYIVNHYDKAAFMTASRLGDKVQVEMSAYDLTKGRITYRNKN